MAAGKSGVVIQKRDQLRKFIKWSIECYNVAATPPACSFSKGLVEVYDREEPSVNAFSRAYLLRLSIDVKWIIADLLVKLPKRRAEVLHSWIEDDTEYYWASLTYSQQAYLKRDRATLADRLRIGLGR